MRKIIAALVAFVAMHSACATTYYISHQATGTGDGTMGNPWATIQNVIPLWGGDSLLLERGGTYYGQINVQHHGVYIGAYGQGSMPVVSGAKALGGFYQYKPNIIACKVWPQPAQLYGPGGWLTQSRFPDVGYTMEKAKPGGYTTAVYWPQAYFWTKEPASKYNPDGNTAYYLQGGLGGISMAGEWHWGAADSTLYLHADTDTVGLKACVLPRGVGCNWNQEGTTVEGVHFEGQTEAGIWARGYGAKHNTVNGCRFTMQCLFGIQFMGVANTFTSSTMQNVLGAGISGYQCDSTKVQGCTFDGIGMVPGQGREGWYNRGAVAVTLDKPNEGQGWNVVTQNIITSTGWCGIQTTMANSTITHNTITDVLLTMSDGAGVYVWGAGVTGTTIAGNNIQGAMGHTQGSNHYNIAAGVYLDELSNLVTTRGNVIGGTGTAGVIVNAGSYDNTIEGNTLMGYGVNIAEWSHKGTTLRNAVVGNLMQPGPGQWALRIESNFGTECDLGTYGGNQLEGNVEKPMVVGTVNNGLAYSAEDVPCEGMRGAFLGHAPGGCDFIQGQIILEYTDEGVLHRQVLRDVYLPKN